MCSGVCTRTELGVVTRIKCVDPRSCVMGSLAMAAIIAHVNAVTQPLFTTSKWPLKEITWSLAEGISTLMVQNPVYAIDMALFLFCVPALSMLAVVVVFLVPCSGRHSALLFRYIRCAHTTTCLLCTQS